MVVLIIIISNCPPRKKFNTFFLFDNSKNLGYALLHTTNDDEMTQKKQKQKSLKSLIFSNIYRIQNCTKYHSIIIQGEIISHPCF